MSAKPLTVEDRLRIIERRIRALERDMERVLMKLPTDMNEGGD